MRLATASARRGRALGIFDNAAYEPSRCQLSEHDLVMLFTDGLFEVEGPGGEYYDQRQLQRAVEQRINLPAHDLCTEVLAEVRQFSASKDFSDDVCLLAMEVERLGLRVA